MGTKATLVSFLSFSFVYCYIKYVSRRREGDLFFLDSVSDEADNTLV